MTKLMWDSPGTRLFETGIDRGVLYVASKAGVSWSGLTSFSEKPTLGASKAFYLDGVKYLEKLGKEEFAGTLQAYTYPDEFGECDGTYSGGNGMFINQQRRKKFGLSYRTLIGNDLKSIDFAYKIHLIYNALASPSTKDYNSIGDNPEANPFSWDISATAVKILDFSPSAHIYVDSRYTNADRLAVLEQILYGSSTTAPRMPTISELQSILTGDISVPIDTTPTGPNQGGTLVVSAVSGSDGEYTISGSDTEMKKIDNDTYQISGSTVTKIDNDTYSIGSS